MAFCSKCGNSLDEGVVFCPKCGTPLEQKFAENTNVQQPQSHNYGQSQEQYNQHQSYQQPFFYSSSHMLILQALWFGLLLTCFYVGRFLFTV
jgi:uncharacterized membrane protein YvbJ